MWLGFPKQRGQRGGHERRSHTTRFLGRPRRAGMMSKLTLGRRRLLPTNAGARQRLNFDEGWKFSRGDFPGAERPGFPTRHGADVDLPHDWSIDGPYGKDEPAGGSGGYLPTGLRLVSQAFHTAGFGRAARADRIRRRLSAQRRMDQRPPSRLRPYGYSSFAYDLTPHLNPAAKNRSPCAWTIRCSRIRRWYSGSGITRHTWLTTTMRCTSRIGACASARLRSAPIAPTIEIATTVRNETTQENRARLRQPSSMPRRHAGPVDNLTSATFRPAASMTSCSASRSRSPSCGRCEIRHLYVANTTLRTETSGAMMSRRRSAFATRASTPTVASC